MPPRLVVIVGPTGAGKSRLSLELAARVGGEVISCDSQQVYIGMDIGTGKVCADDRARVRHHLLDVVTPDEDMTAARFVTLADAAVVAVATRGKPAIVCGGTGLYVRALLLGLFEGPPASPDVRAALEQHSDDELRIELERVDAVAASRIDRRDRKRTIRALEVFRITGEPISAHQARHDHKSMARRYEARVIGLAPERDALYRAIDARVDAMVADGLEREVETLREGGYRPPLRSQQAIGYAEIHSLLDGQLSRTRAIELVKRNSRHYARRQLSWYRPDTTITWHAAMAEVDLADLERYLIGS
jgi:tRNA dimethylallyltransferase